jgi:hypothetical protein
MVYLRARFWHDFAFHLVSQASQQYSRPCFALPRPHIDEEPGMPADRTERRADARESAWPRAHEAQQSSSFSRQLRDAWWECLVVPACLRAGKNPKDLQLYAVQGREGETKVQYRMP